MASKIQSHNFYVAITPYKVDGCEEEFNELSVTVNFDDRRKHFYVSVHAGWKSDFGHGCILMGDNNPLSAPQYVKVKDAPKNSQKTINEMGAALETAKDAIAWLFNQRDWTRLYAAVRNIALYGYTEQFRKQMEELMNKNTNNQNKEDNTMRLNMNKNQETKNAAQQQVNNNKSEAIVKQVDVIGLMNGLKTNGTAKLSDYATPIEDAQAEEVVESVAVGEMTVDSIMPKMSAEPEEPVKVEGSEYTVKDDEGKDVTFESVIPAAIAKSEPVVIDEEVTQKPQVTLRRKVKQTYKHVALPAKNGGEWSKVYGFASEKEAQAMADRLPNSVRATWDYGENQEGRETKTRHYYLRFGVRYLEVAAELADALNQGDKAVVARVVAKAHGVYAGAVADGKAEDAAKKAAKGETKPRGTMPKAKTQERKPRGTMPKTQPAAPQGKTYTAADMEATIREAFGALAGAMKADVKQFEPLIAAAMKKAA